MIKPELQIKLHEFILEKSDGNIAIYGTGTGAIKTVIALGPLFDNIHYFIDSNKSKLTFYNKQIKQLEDIDVKSLTGVILASSFNEEITEKLIAYGICKSKIFKCFPQESEEKDTLPIPIGKQTYGIHIGNTNFNIVKSIGAFCSINDTAIIGTLGNHPTNKISTHPFMYNPDFGYVKERVKHSGKNGPIIIENDVWIGTRAIILPGVTIGSGAIIGAGAIVTKDVPPYAVVAGVPAKVIRYRFNEDEIKQLLRIKWWDWSDNKIEENLHLFNDVKKFITLHKKGI